MKDPVQILTTYNNSLMTNNNVNHVCPIGNNRLMNLTSSSVESLRERTSSQRQEPLDSWPRESGIETAAEVSIR